MLKIFKSNDNNFYKLFEQAAENNLKAAKLLNQLCLNFKNPERVAKKIHDLEHTGDEILHTIFLQINKSFMTPIDREDIIVLTHALDDVIDFIYASASDFDTYQVKKATKCAQELSTLILHATKAVNQALPKLRKRSMHHEIQEAIVEINRLENEADDVFKTGLRVLFKNPKNPVDVIRFQAIYTTMEHATDACERIASILGGFTIKYA